MAVLRLRLQAEMNDQGDGRLYFLVFIHIGIRRICYSPCAAHTTGEWTAQQARSLDLFLQKEELPCKILQRDSDSKFTEEFDDVFSGERRRIKTTSPNSPNLQAFVERVLQKLKYGVLNDFCAIDEKHLDTD